MSRKEQMERILHFGAHQYDYLYTVVWHLRSDLQGRLSNRYDLGC